ncbi:MAG: hypothetical protein ACXWCR_14440, partial [Flavitalea sp.]
DATVNSGASDFVIKSHYSTAGGTLNNMVIKGQDLIFNESKTTGFGFGNVIVANGNLGVGTGIPSAKLDVIGNVKISDGTEGVGKVLTSDATGTASWQDAPRTVFIKDVKPANTNGGSAVVGWQTRVLNTIEGDASIVSLAGNQITLQPGTYIIEASAPAREVDNHQIKLQNITDATYQIIGTSAQGPSSSGAITSSFMMGTVILASPKTFEIQHYCATAVAGGGLGTSVNSGLPQVYTQVKITKVK